MINNILVAGATASALASGVYTEELNIQNMLKDVLVARRQQLI